jgi:hypothetical protein
MAKFLKEVDEDEDNRSMLSSIDINEYWENIKRTAQAENKIISEMVDGKTSEKALETFPDSVMKALQHERELENPDQQIDDAPDELVFNSPKNEFERMLHRKIYELNKLQTDYHKLQLENQKEKNLRLKAEETILKQKRQHLTEKKVKRLC